MEHATILRFAEQLRREVEAAGGGAAVISGDDGTEPLRVPAALYRDRARCELERAALFGGPRIVAASASLRPGDCLPVDAPGLSALVVRGSDGVVRAFANACRHRGTRLVDKPCAAAKALTCPYHAWTYDLTGALIHVPHADAFAGIDLGARGLMPLPVTERHGLIWLGSPMPLVPLVPPLPPVPPRTAPGALDLDRYLGGLDADLAALDLDHHVLWQRSQTTRRCNWKLVIEAFLDGYHIRVLHRDSVYRFFLDAASLAEREGPHIRAVTGRRALLEAPRPLGATASASASATASDVGDQCGDRRRPASATTSATTVGLATGLRQLATPSLLLFPSTVVVEHPDFVSIMTMHPLAPNETAWDHMMLVPAARAGETEHWTRSWQLIEEGVFQREDLWVCEQAQRSIDTGASDEMVFGGLEAPARWFHAAIEDALTRAAA